MLFRNRWFLCAGALLFPSLVSAQESPITIEQLVAAVEAHSKAVVLEKLKVKIAETQVTQAKLNSLPVLAVLGSVDKASNMPIYEQGIFEKPVQHDIVHTLYSAQINSYLNLFEGHKTQNEIKLAKIEAEISKVDREKQAALVKLKAINLFVNIYLQLQWKMAMDKDIAEKEHELIEIRNIHKAGVVLESDVLRAELELSKRRMTLVEIENGIVVLRQELNVLIGREDGGEIVPVISGDEWFSNQLTLNEAIEEALHEAYDAEVSHQHTKVAETKLKLNKGNYSPKLGLASSFQMGNPQIFLYPYNPSWYSLGIVGLKLSYNISSLYHNKEQVRKAKLELSSAKTHHEFVDDEVRTKVYKAFYAYDEAIKRKNIHEQNKKYADENARILKNAYFSQTALITDLLDANLQKVKAEFELEQAKMDIVKTYYSLKFEIGKL